MPVVADSSPDPAADRYDVIVIGAGIAGLTTGALLARAGRRVLVIEANDDAGGYCRSLVSGGYRFDRAVHFVAVGGVHGPAARLLNDVLGLIGAGGLCDLVQADPFYEARFPDLTVTVGAGREGFVAALTQHFPGEERGVRRLVDLGERLFEEFLGFPLTPGPLDLVRSPLTFPNLVRYRKATPSRTSSNDICEILA